MGIGCAAFLLVLIIAAFLLLADGTDTWQGTPPAGTSEEAATQK